MIFGSVKVLAHAGVHIVKTKVERLETLEDGGSTSNRAGVPGFTGGSLVRRIPIGEGRQDAQFGLTRVVVVAGQRVYKPSDQLRRGPAGTRKCLWRRRTVRHSPLAMGAHNPTACTWAFARLYAHWRPGFGRVRETLSRHMFLPTNIALLHGRRPVLVH